MSRVSTGDAEAGLTGASLVELFRVRDSAESRPGKDSAVRRQCVFFFS